MKNEKICISKAVGFFAAAVIVLVGVILIMTKMSSLSTSTNTRASGVVKSCTSLGYGGKEQAFLCNSSTQTSLGSFTRNGGVTLYCCANKEVSASCESIMDVSQCQNAKSCKWTADSCPGAIGKCISSSVKIYNACGPTINSCKSLVTALKKSQNFSTYKDENICLHLKQMFNDCELYIDNTCVERGTTPPVPCSVIAKQGNCDVVSACRWQQGCYTQQGERYSKCASKASHFEEACGLKCSNFSNNEAVCMQQGGCVFNAADKTCYSADN